MFQDDEYRKPIDVMVTNYRNGETMECAVVVGEQTSQNWN